MLGTEVLFFEVLGSESNRNKTLYGTATLQFIVIHVMQIIPLILI